MRTTAIELTDEQTAGLEKLAEVTGETEADLLRQATAGGLRAIRFEQGVRLFREGQVSSGEAAELAGLPRAEFLQALVDRGLRMLEGPSTLAEELSAIAVEHGSERLARMAAALAEVDD